MNNNNNNTFNDLSKQMRALLRQKLFSATVLNIVALFKSLKFKISLSPSFKSDSRSFSVEVVRNNARV